MSSTDQRSLANTPSVGSATVATLLVANPARTGFTIQNQGTNPLFVALGVQATNNGVYHIILKGGTAVADGNGGTYSQLGGSCYTGAIFASGTVPSYTILEQ